MTAKPKDGRNQPQDLVAAARVTTSPNQRLEAGRARTFFSTIFGQLVARAKKHRRRRSQIPMRCPADGREHAGAGVDGPRHPEGGVTSESFRELRVSTAQTPSGEVLVDVRDSGPECDQISSINSLRLSTQPSPLAWASVCRSAARLSKRMADDCGRARTSPAAPYFTAQCPANRAAQRRDGGTPVSGELSKARTHIPPRC